MQSGWQRFGHIFLRFGLGARWSLGIALLLFTTVAAQAAGPQAVKLTADEFAFTPNTVTLTAGQPVQLTIVNTGKVAHDLKSSLPIANLTYQHANNPVDEQAANIKGGVLDVDFDPGTTAQVTFTPTKAGTYTFKCDVPGHAQLGMTGTFVVQPAPTTGVQAVSAAPTPLPVPAPSASAPTGAGVLPATGHAAAARPAGGIWELGLGVVVIAVAAVGGGLALSRRRR